MKKHALTSSLTKSQKFIIFISILYELFIFLFSSVITSQDRNAPSFFVPFLFLSLPCILYWGGVWIWGFGYLISAFKKLIGIILSPIRIFKNKKRKNNKSQKQEEKLIKEAAENYGKWYSGWRSYPYYIWTIGCVLAVIILLLNGKQEDAIYVALGWLLYIIPFWFLSALGYRWAMYVGAAFFIVDWAASQFQNYRPITIIYCIAVVNLFSKSIKIENYRVRHNLSKTRKVVKDHLIAFIPAFLLFVLSSYFLYHYNEKELETVREYVGVVYRNTEGYKKYCLKHNYDLRNYAESYYKKFSKKIEETNKKLRKLDGSSIEENFDMITQNIELVKLFDTAIENDITAYRKYLILSVVANHNSIPIDSVEWNDTYYEILNEKETCEFIDKNSDDIIDDGGIARLE